ncbi:MAG: anaerobic ribonucleoside-triphosphate reductase activating protein [Spirochaetales bacterium]
MLLGTLLKTTLSDYPGNVATAWFLCGCNIRCPYCYNAELVVNTKAPNDAVDLQTVYRHLQKRKNVLSGFVISGGEALIHDELPEIIATAKSIGYKVKLDTNGLLPEKLKNLFKKEITAPDYIAIDIKTTPEKYSLVGFTGSAHDLLSESIAIAAGLGLSNIEFRTVLVPNLVAKGDIQTMATLLPAGAMWYFAPFQNMGCLDPLYNAMAPYGPAEMNEIINIAKQYIPKACLR